MSKVALQGSDQDFGKRRYDSPAKSLHADWDRLCERYLPIVHEKSIWRYSRESVPNDPEQGWKLHISATILTANRILEKVAPVLRKLDIQFKATATLDELSRLNCGLFYGFSQVGKFMTIYPNSAEMAVSLARKCHELTYKLTAPNVPYDRRFGQNGCVFYRYGAFTALGLERPDGTRVPAVRNDEGELVPDRREPGAAVPDWTTDPFHDEKKRRAKASAQASPLRTTFLGYEALSQRGKGGVYRALDLSVLPARLCVLKEGRRHGETEWDGRDGFWRVRHEAAILQALRVAGLDVPQVYATFQAEKNFYLVTEFIEGDSLQSLVMRKRKKLPILKALRYGSQLADQLARIHAAGWIWRDCKPLNLIVTENDILRPLDFEGACPVDHPDKAPWGTRGYLAPGSAKKEASIPDDLYALGVTLHQLLTSRTPGPEPPPSIGSLRRRVPVEAKELVAGLLDPDSGSRPDADFVSRALASMCRH